MTGGERRAVDRATSPEAGASDSGATHATLAEVLVVAWRQVLDEGRAEIDLAGQRSRVGWTRSQGLRTVAFVYGAVPIEGIEQNPEKSSRWAQLARDGKRIMQFRANRRYIANVCDGTLTRYSGWAAAGLPE